MQNVISGPSQWEISHAFLCFHCLLSTDEAVPILPPTAFTQKVSAHIYLFISMSSKFILLQYNCSPGTDVGFEGCELREREIMCLEELCLF